MGPVIGDTFILNVTLSNSGDEAARDVMVSLITPPGGISSEPVFVGTLEPNSGVLAQFKVAIPFKTKPGTYPLIIKTAYADANAYPFSTLSSTSFKYMRPAQTLLRGDIKDVVLAHDGEIETALTVSNLDELPHTVHVQLHLPDEISAGEYSRDVEVGARGLAHVTVPLKSAGALPNSIYQVYATLDFEKGGMHYSSTVSGTVEVVSAQGGAIPSWMPLAALAVLVFAFAYHQLRKAPAKQNEDGTRPA